MKTLLLAVALLNTPAGEQDLMIEEMILQDPQRAADVVDLADEIAFRGEMVIFVKHDRSIDSLNNKYPENLRVTGSTTIIVDQSPDHRDSSPRAGRVKELELHRRLDGNRVAGLYGFSFYRPNPDGDGIFDSGQVIEMRLSGVVLDDIVSFKSK